MTRDDIASMAREAGFIVDDCSSGPDVWVDDGYYIEKLERFAALVAEAEREACARVCEDIPLPTEPEELTHLPTIDRCIAAIRARGDK